MDNTKSFQEIQGYFSFGYLYLIILGILNETLFYNQIGVNILNYSSILDVLISPISRLTSNIRTLGVFVVILFLAFNLPGILSKKKDRSWFKKFIKLKENVATQDEVKYALTKKCFFLVAIGLFGFFIGSGSGKGSKLEKKIETGKIEYNDKITFISGDKLDVEIIGTNSTYLFYLYKESQKVQIAPIDGSIKKFENNK